MYRLSVIGFKVRCDQFEIICPDLFLTDKINYITVDIYGKRLTIVILIFFVDHCSNSLNMYTVLNVLFLSNRSMYSLTQEVVILPLLPPLTQILINFSRGKSKFHNLTTRTFIVSQIIMVFYPSDWNTIIPQTKWVFFFL